MPRSKKIEEPAIPAGMRRTFIDLEVPVEDWGKPSGFVIAFAHSLKVPAGLFVHQPIRLREFQMKFIRDVYNPISADGLRQRTQGLLSIGRRGGKALSLDTPIPTPTGFVPIGAITAGDTVLGSDGQPVTVLAAHPVMHDRPCYRVIFEDGDSVVCDADHLWVFRDRKGHPVIGTAQALATDHRVLRADGKTESRYRISVPDIAQSRFGPSLSVIAIEPCDSVPVRCLTVDAPDSLFLCSDYKPTHNTLLAAVLVLVHLIGPMKRDNSTIVSAAKTRDQAKFLFRYCADMVKANPILSARLKILANTSRILHRNDGSVYRAISSDAGGSFGQGIDFVVYDELAQAPKRTLYDMLMTSLGSQVEPLMMIISTQSPANDHIMSELVDYGQKLKSGELKDPSFTAHVYAADDDCDLLDERQWHKANPALGDYRSLKEMRATMHRAVEVPSLEAAVRNLYLNQRVAAESPFLTPNVWLKNQGEVLRDLFRDGRPVYGGLDLSSKTDLSAMVLCTADDDMNVHLLTTVWSPGDTLMARAARDRAPYDTWHRQGFLNAVPGSALDYEFLARDIAEYTSGMNVTRMAFDRWRIDILKQDFEKIGYMPKLVPHGQGYKDMSPAVDAFLELAIEGKLRHGNNPILRWCVSNTFIETDAAGNRKPTKARSWGRIDAAVAGIMAISAMKCSSEPTLDFSTMIA